MKRKVVDTMDGMFTQIMGLLQKGVTGVGAIIAVFGAVNLGRSFKDSNGPGIGSGIAEIVGGAIIIAAAAFISNVTL